MSDEFLLKEANNHPLQPASGLGITLLYGLCYYVQPYLLNQSEHFLQAW